MHKISIKTQLSKDVIIILLLM